MNPVVSGSRASVSSVDTTTVEKQSADSAKKSTAPAKQGVFRSALKRGMEVTFFPTVGMFSILKGRSQEKGEVKQKINEITKAITSAKNAGQTKVGPLKIQLEKISITVPEFDVNTDKKPSEIYKNALRDNIKNVGQQISQKQTAFDEADNELAEFTGKDNKFSKEFHKVVGQFLSDELAKANRAAEKSGGMKVEHLGLVGDLQAILSARSAIASKLDFITKTNDQQDLTGSQKADKEFATKFLAVIDKWTIATRNYIDSETIGKEIKSELKAAQSQPSVYLKAAGAALCQVGMVLTIVPTATLGVCTLVNAAVVKATGKNMWGTETAETASKKTQERLSADLAKRKPKIVTTKKESSNKKEQVQLSPEEAEQAAKFAKAEAERAAKLEAEKKAKADQVARTFAAMQNPQAASGDKVISNEDKEKEAMEGIDQLIRDFDAKIDNPKEMSNDELVQQALKKANSFRLNPNLNNTSQAA